MEPWNGWVHCTGTTYGTWLRGDERGWRSRHAREWCEGDYRSRPDPREHAWRLERSRALLRRPGVRLSAAARDVACRRMAEALAYHDAEPLAICVGSVHWHVLLRAFPRERVPLPRATRRRTPRLLVGIAKKEAARGLSDAGLCPPGGVFARGCGRRWIKDRRHQMTVVRYILKHQREGAATWSVVGGTVGPLTFDFESPAKPADCSLRA